MMQLELNATAQILAFLDKLGVGYRLIRHAPAHTMEDLSQAQRELGALIPKNLFLTPRNNSAFYLCLVMPDAQFRTADISKQIGSSRLSFATAEQLRAMLDTHPGAVSPLGLIFESARDVKLLIDRRLARQPLLAFHPNDNAQSLSMTGSDFFQRFLPATGHDFRWVDVA